jgi:hypothetical protein
MRHSPWRVLYGLVGENVDFILTCLRWSDEGTKTLVSRGNLDMSWWFLGDIGSIREPRYVLDMCSTREPRDV